MIKYFNVENLQSSKFDAQMLSLLIMCVFCHKLQPSVVEY